jgi:hypothetical protein
MLFNTIASMSLLPSLLEIKLLLPPLDLFLLLLPLPIFCVMQQKNMFVKSPFFSSASSASSSSAETSVDALPAASFCSMAL